MGVNALASDKSSRIAEYKRRKVRSDSKVVPQTKLDEHLEAGWSRTADLKSGIKIKKDKSVEEILENDFWTLLYLLGYKTLNIGRDFQIEITDNSGREQKRQIDIFAIDDETIIVAECKCSEIRTKSKSLQKELAEFDTDKKAIARALTNRLGALPQKILWMFVTKNIEWSSGDLTRARDMNIRPVTELEMRYFSEVAKRLGPAARFQFHATFLANSKVGSLSDVKVPAIKTKVGGCRAYFFVAPARKLLPISYVNHRDLHDPEASPSYQRLITRARLGEVAKFIQTGGYFANAIIVNFKDEARFDRAAPETEDGTTMGMLTLPGTYKSVWIIDGQHRLYGFAELNEDDISHRVPVIAFEKMKADEEGRLFKTINTEQKKVSPRLLDALRGEQDLHSSDRPKQIRAIASRVFEQLSSEIGGPFEERFKSADLPDGPDRTLTLSSMVNALVNSSMLGRQAPKPQDRFIQGVFTGDTPKKTINATASALSSYFDLIRAAAPGRWDGDRTGLLCTNVAVEAYIRLLAELCNHIHSETRTDPRELSEVELINEIKRLLDPVLKYLRIAPSDEFTKRFSVPFGSGGPVRYYFALVGIVQEEFPSFKPTGHEEYTRQLAEETVEDVEKKLRSIEQMIPEFVIERLKKIYPDEKYLQRGVKNQSILTKAFEKQMMNPPDEQGPLETYLDFIQFKDIISTKENWPHFSDKLNIRLPSDSHAARYLNWFDEINKLRRVRGHPFGKSYKDEDVIIINYVFSTLLSQGLLKQ